MTTRSFLRLALAATLVLAPPSAVGAQSPQASLASPPSERPSLGWRDELTGGPDMLDVATTVAPISSLARDIGGERIRLRGIVPDGLNSHTFEPRPSDARTLANADLIVVNGLNLELPTLDLAAASKRADTPILMLGDDTIDQEAWLFDTTFPESQGDPNPHLWMDVQYAIAYAGLLRDWFSAADQANAAYFATNYERLKVRLEDLDARIRAAVETVAPADRRLLTYHDSWAYWARRYGFEVIGAVQASDFSDPSARDVARLIDQVRAEQVPAIFGSEVFPSPVLEQVARETGATFVDALRDDEPPGEWSAPGHTYVGMMSQNMRVMIDALGGEGSALFADLRTDATYLP